MYIFAVNFVALLYVFFNCLDLCLQMEVAECSYQMTHNIVNTVFLVSLFTFCI